MLPVVKKSELGIKTVDMSGLPKRFLNDGELDVIVALIRNVNAKNVMEIGCNEGRTAAAVLRELPDVENYVGIDVPPGYKFAKQVQKNEVPAKPGYLAAHDKRFALTLNKRGSFDCSPDDFGIKFDAIFIDGDHGRKAVMHDTNLARQIINQGGIIIWHDYHALGTVDVKACLDELFKKGAPIKHVDGTWIAYCMADEWKQEN